MDRRAHLVLDGEERLAAVEIDDVAEAVQLATALSFTNATLIEQAVINVNRVPSGNLGQTAVPADIYRTRGDRVLCQVTGHPLFKRWWDHLADMAGR
ncbi:hypothetical protein B5V03_18540 [Bradyrhizobium betae]|uniref:Uncharacterized protein n=1 Tax=Bradyrhizobium betae TaxID=244734 RepID=A0A4Q1V3P9_9BRAD|nr:hypothetical protein [Bradyrhizobium betae]RXT45673.1 hypothetical protein B5V03_18540 [Bradyrhizobium betae]